MLLSLLFALVPLQDVPAAQNAPAAPPAGAQPSAAQEAACIAAGTCRRVGELQVEAEDGSIKTVPVNRVFPWVVRDNVMLFSGESATIRLEPRGGKLFPVLVRAGAESELTKPKAGEIRFLFSPSLRGNVMLEVESHYPETLDYAALAVTDAGPKRTSVCSLVPGKPVFESWSAPILQLAAWSFTPTKDPGCKTIDPAKTGATPN